MTSPVRISRADGSEATSSLITLPIAIRIRASTSAGPAVSRMTSLTPQSLLNAESPPSVVIAIIGQSIPVATITRVSAFAAGRSRRASMKRHSISGISIKIDASAGRILTWCWRSPRLGSTSALAPSVLVRRRTLAIGKSYYCRGIGLEHG